MLPLYQHFRTALAEAYAPREANALARLVFEDVLGMTQTDLYADKISEISEDDVRRLDIMLARLLRHEPVQYVLGTAAFCGRTFRVAPGVLIPRPETEELVAWVIEEQQGKPLRLLDGGTGSGCIAVCLALELPKALVEAWDISPEALAIAEDNAHRLGAKVRFCHRSLLAPPPVGETFHCIVSNPPYIRECEKQTMETNVLDHEPHLALFVPDDDALLFYRALAELGRQALVPGGMLYAEINEALGEETARLLRDCGYCDVEVRKDAFGRARMVRGKWLPTNECNTKDNDDKRQ